MQGAALKEKVKNIKANIESIRQKIKRSIETFSNKVKVYRNTKNEFNEPLPLEEIFIAEILGQYYKGQMLRIGTSTSTKGAIKTEYAERFLTIIDLNSLKIKEGDFFMLNGIKYKIFDLGNVENIYFDFSIVRTSWNI